LNKGVKKEHAGHTILDRSRSLKSVEIRLLCSCKQMTRLLDFLSSQVLLEMAFVPVAVLQKVGSPADSIVGSVPWTSNGRWPVCCWKRSLTWI